VPSHGPIKMSSLQGALRRKVEKASDLRPKFRTYRGVEDIPWMVAQENSCWKKDLVDAVTTEEEMEESFADPVNMDPSRDVIVIEVKDTPIGHSKVSWHEGLDGGRQYTFYAFVSPEWIGRGVREMLVRRSEKRLREVAREHPKSARKHFESYANSEANDWKTVLEGEGYAQAMHLFEMVRPDLENIPDLSLPAGVEVGPVGPEHYKVIWDAMKEALRDERFFSEHKYSDKAFEKSMKSPTFMPELWQIAWSGDEVVGGVHNYINHEENREFGRLWGHTERIFVSRQWRKKGIAKGLIARSLRVLKEAGMEQATLDVDTENPSGAVDIYKSLGYRENLHFIFFRKEFS
jgi:mycothiol synthase